MLFNTPTFSLNTVNHEADKLMTLLLFVEWLQRKSIQKFHCFVAEGEQEAEWLVAAGLAQLATPFLSGREAAEAEVAAALRRLPRAQAEAARRRVRKLNRTLRRQKARRPDIRDVFRDHEVIYVIL